MRRQDIKTPVKIAIGVLIATQAMNIVFVPYSPTPAWPCRLVWAPV
jgi:peptidoglycan biosynthesis protein MviN/MurJ (putative lipid II flippase)